MVCGAIVVTQPFPVQIFGLGAGPAINVGSQPLCGW